MERYSSSAQKRGTNRKKVLQIYVQTDLSVESLNCILLFFQKTLLRYYLFEGLRYVWLDRKGSFCRVR